jgi:hypothetical protein
MNLELEETQLLANRILFAVFNELQSHKGKETQIHYLNLNEAMIKEGQSKSNYNGKGKSEFNYIGLGDPIDDETAKDLIMKQIQASLEKHGRVCMYTCRDNGCISLDWPEDESDLEACDVYDSLPELYWAID